jgi:hypothetical protein
MRQYNVFKVPLPSSFLVVDISPERELARVIAGGTLSGGV